MLTIDRSTITDGGMTLLNSGNPINITSIKTGSGTYTSSEDIVSRTTLKSQMYSYTPSTVQVDGSSRTVSGLLSNYDPDTDTAIVTSDYTITEVGLFATVNGSDVLFAIGISYDGTEVPAFTGQNKSEIVVEWAMGLSGTDTVTVTATGAVALATDLNTHIGNDVYSANGVHGIRAVDDNGKKKLQVDDNGWKDIDGGHVIVDESGTSLAQRSKLKFTGGVSITDDSTDDETVVNIEGEQIQVTSLPTASFDELGNVYQYLGTTTSDYTHGYFYECVLDGSTYYWKNIPVQDDESGTIIVTPPTVVVGTYTYNGSPQGPTITWATGMSDYCVVTNATQTDAGSYQLTIALKNTAKMVWNDGASGLSTADKIYNYSIAKANQTITLSSNSVTLDETTPTVTVTVSDNQGTISATSSNTSKATVSVSGTTVTITRVGSTGSGATVTVTVTAASTTNYNEATATVTASVRYYKVMTIILDFNDSNPATWATYANDAVGMTAGSSAWDDFFGIYECMLLNGVEGKKLNPNNLAQHLDGTSADITSGAEGDVMTKFPKRGWKVTKGGSNNKVVTLSLTDDPNKSGYSYKAHYYKGQACSAFYRGCFKGYETRSKLWSLSDKPITADNTIGAFRTLAQAKGTGYEQSTYYAMTLLQIMYLLKYKGANAQIAIGRGYVDGNSAAAQTGGTVAKGRDWGESTGKYQMCFLGQEDFFGNVWEWLDGLVTNSSRNYLVCDTTQNIAFTDGGTNYTNVGGGWSSNQGNYISMVIGTNDAPLTASEFSGSETTFLCDIAYASASYVANVGGRWDSASSAGAFLGGVSANAFDARTFIAARLMYFKVEAA